MTFFTRITLLFATIFYTYACTAQTVMPPTGLTATPFERHINLRWTASPSTNVTSYKIYRSTDGGATFSFLKQTGKQTYAFDWTGDEGLELTRQYQVTAVANALNESVNTDPVSATTFTMNDEQLLDMEQEAAFRYFWDFGHPASGMARERNVSGDIVTSGGTGFGVMAIVAGVERGWITREQGVNRMIQLVSFLQFADRFHGVFPHWMDGNTGNVVAFSQYDNGGDLIETAFLMQGLLTVREYFDQDTPLESAVRDVITDLWEDVEWDWYRRNNSGVLYWHWSPNYNWQMNFPIRGFNEGQIAYILAIASPTHPVPASLYQTGWTANGNYANPSIHYGHKVYTGPFGGGPMFFAHYSYLGFDPRNKKDLFCNYFVRNRNHALIQNSYSINNPENHDGYSADCWGLTASDNPWGYLAHDIYPSNDNGTIAPTAALASMPYTPNESLAALRHFYRNLGDKLWGDFGFYDSFNEDQNWISNSYLAIDQGPIVVMMENYRTGLFWNKFMQNPEIQPALNAIGFVADISSSTEELAQKGFSVLASPNPARSGESVRVELQIMKKTTLSAALYDAQGRLVKNIFTHKTFETGVHVESFSAQAHTGTYFLKITDEKGTNSVVQMSYEK